MSRPSAPDLLMTARQLLLDELLPALPRDLHYQARMIANAMSIAARDQQQGSSCAAEEAEQLTALLERPDSGDLQELRKELASSIRTGRFDQHPRLLQQLLQINQRQLAINNPKAVRD